MTSAKAAPYRGATKWESIWRVVVLRGANRYLVPYFWPCAALGETMAVTMVVGNNPRIAASCFHPVI